MDTVVLSGFSYTIAKARSVERPGEENTVLTLVSADDGATPGTTVEVWFTSDGWEAFCRDAETRRGLGVIVAGADEVPRLI